MDLLTIDKDLLKIKIIQHPEINHPIGESKAAYLETKAELAGLGMHIKIMILGGAGHLISSDTLPLAWCYKDFRSDSEIKQFFKDLPEVLTIDTPESIRASFGYR